jgi:excisionase family DNA binding protein
VPESSSGHNSRQSVRKSTKVGKLITLDDAAERLAISKRGVRRLISSGKLKAYRINARIIRIDSADLASVLEPVVPTGKP